MDMSSDALSAEARCVERLPYAFAKRHARDQRPQLEEGIELWVRPACARACSPRCSARWGGGSLWRELANEAFDAALARAYERGASQAGHHDRPRRKRRLAALAENLPKVADLLESEDDAPIVRLINALFSQAVREGASDIHIEPSTALGGALPQDGMLRDVLEPPQRHTA